MNKSDVLQRIREIIAKERLTSFLYSFFFSLSVIEITLFLIAVAENLFRFSSQTRTILFFSFLIFSFVILAKIALPKFLILLRKISFNEIILKSRILGGKDKNINDELANAIELSEKSSENYSNELILAYVGKILNKLPEQFFESENKHLLKKITIYFSFSIFILLFTLSITPLNNSLIRIWQYNKIFKEKPVFSFVVFPGDTTIAKNDSLTITVKTKGKSPEKFILYGKNSKGGNFLVWKKFRKRNSNKYKFTLRKITESFQYFFASSEVSSDTFDVTAITLPYVRRLEAKVFPPAYSKEKPYWQSDGNFSALKGTTVKLSITSNKPLKKGIIKFSYGKEIPLKINKNKIKVSFRLKKTCNYKIFLFDSLGYKNRYPVNYSVNIKEDEFPEVKIILPGKDIELGNEDILPLVIKISDDFGISKIFLHYSLVSSQFEKRKSVGKIALNNSRKPEQTVLFDWNLRPLKIEVNDVYEYFVEVFDNDIISGPKKTISKKYKIFLPPLEKFLENAAKESKESLKDFVKTLRQAENLKKEMQKLSYELKKNKTKPNWQQKQKMKDAVDKFRELTEKARKLQKKLSEQQKNLQKRNLLSEETIKKYEELQKLLSKLNDETLKRALQKMNEDIDTKNLSDLRKELENLKKNEEAFRKSIERTIELFKRLLAEQKTDEIIKRIKNIEEEQKKISDETKKGNLSPKKIDNLTQRENELKNKLENLRKEAEKLSEMMKNTEDMPTDEMQKFNENMQKQKNEKLAEEASQNMMMRNMQNAMNIQNKILGNMRELEQQMQNVQNSMRMQNQMKAMAEMMRLTREIIYLSKKEENLKNKIAKSKLNNSEIRNLANEQNEILSELNFVIKRMQKLSHKTFAITPEMGNALGKARMQMNTAIGQMQERLRFGVKAKTENAMASLNDAADMMQNMLSAMANRQGNGQGGMISLMQQLKKMSGMQMQINGKTKQMKGKGKSQSELAQMQRLASQQSALQKSLEELNREAKSKGKSKIFSSDLEKIAEEMKEVVSDLQTGEITDELIKKQERIFSRMLEAQRSINEKDFEKRRESEVARKVTGKLPPKLDLQNETKSRIEKEMLEAEKEGYKKDYRELIKNYYKELKNDKTK